MSASNFKGPFAPMCELYIAQKRAIGFKYVQEEKTLRRFDNFCKKYDVQNYAITKEIAFEWCKILPNEKDVTRNSRVGLMQRFALFLNKQGYQSYLLPALPRQGARHVPYIFTKCELKRIFQILDNLAPLNSYPNRHLMYPVLVRMLYGCGLRISEALSLTKEDVNIGDGILYIRHGKNDKERLVPMSESLTILCRQYMLTAHQTTSNKTPMFYTKGQVKYYPSSISVAFRGFLWDAGIPYQGKDIGPRLHDLRHTFVYHNIKKCAEEGVCVSEILPVLSKYLGHSNARATQWYLRLTAEIYPHIRDICERELSTVYAEILNFGMEVGVYDE